MATSDDRIRIPGINVQFPWAGLILSKNKTVETRGYPISRKYLNKPLALIETPGRSSKLKARVIGIIRVVECFRYTSEEKWKKDRRHKVATDDPMFNFKATKEKWGWLLKVDAKVIPPILAPKKRGIKYCSSCAIPRANLSGNFRSDRKFI